MKTISLKERGSSLVEFALVAPLFFVLIFALFDIGFAVWTYNSISQAVREAGRHAVVHGEGTRLPNGAAGPSTEGPINCSTANANTIAAVACSHAQAINPEKLEITSSWPTGNTIGSTVIVHAKYNYSPFTQLIDFTVAIESQTEMPIACCTSAAP
ncbi:MAG: pilus assembly protein [Sinobacterium sp.]|nr:pilus assembly protein [Sinobacterium sp.]